MNNNREIRQLWYVSNAYFNLAKDLKSDMSTYMLKKTVQDWTDLCENTENLFEHNDFIMLTAHLSSSAVRLEALESNISNQYRNDLYYKILTEKNIETRESLFKKHKNEILHILMRHKIGHTESEIKNKRNGYEYMLNEFFKLTISELYNSIENGINVLNQEPEIKHIA